MTNDDLWNEVHECFDEDDGSLPGIEIGPLSPDGLSAIYAMLRRRSQPAGTEPAWFWDRATDSALWVDSVDDAASLVALGHAEPFHHTIQGLTAAGVELPVLGLFVFADSIEIDYRMGPDWGPAEVTGFFELLRDCCVLAPRCVVRPSESEGPPIPTQFARAWQRYLAAHPISGA